jgi:hypothetical protein
VSAFERNPRVLAHTDGPDTSHAAAVGDRTTNRYRVLKLYAALGPVTSYRAWLESPAGGFDLAEIRRRTTDLLLMGLLERTGDKERIASTGRYAHKLALTDAGRKALA